MKLKLLTTSLLEIVAILFFNLSTEEVKTNSEVQFIFAESFKVISSPFYVLNIII